MEELAQDKQNLIAQIVKNDKKFANNEDLYEDFFNETCKRCFLVAKNVSSENTLTPYIKRVASTAILTVLKDSGRLRRTKAGYTPTLTVPLEYVSYDETNYSDVIIKYDVPAPDDTPEDIVIKNETLRQLIDNLYKINEDEPEKKYLYLYKLRYEECMTQKEIAEKMSISQSEVSKRLFRLLEKIKQTFN